MRSLGSGRAPAHVVLALGLGLAACEGPAVEARAVWIDSAGGEDERRVQIYDRGTREQLRVAGQAAPQEYLRLGPRGRGLLLRAGAQAGAWFDLDDGRRLPLRLPERSLEGDTVHFSADAKALWWLEADALQLVPLSPASARVEADSGLGASLRFAGAFAWGQSSAAAPVLLLRGQGETAAASFVRYPVNEGGREQGLTRFAVTSALPLPSAPAQRRDCAAIADCGVSVALAPNGMRAIVAGSDGAFYGLEARAGASSGQLELPPALADSSSASPLQLLDGSVSVWSGAGQLFRWDLRRADVEVLPVFFAPPLHWVSAQRGSAFVLLSASGSMLRVDARASEVLNLETSDCTPSGSFSPVVSPSGRVAAWTCESTQTAGGEVLLRVSRAGLERFVGVPMRAVAIDDEGAVLLYSVLSTSGDVVDGISPDTRPRNLFTLSASGVLARVDELEPAPAPAVAEISAPSVYLQGAALD